MNEKALSTVTAADALKYVAAIVRRNVEWTTDAIGGSVCEGADGHEDETAALRDLVGDVAAMLEPFGDPNRYSDGRAVYTSRWIVDGELSTGHVWHPDPAAEAPQSWRGDLPSGDPDVPSPGIFEVTTSPADQQLHIRVVRIEPS